MGRGPATHAPIVPALPTASIAISVYDRACPCSLHPCPLSSGGRGMALEPHRPRSTSLRGSPGLPVGSGAPPPSEGPWRASGPQRSELSVALGWRWPKSVVPPCAGVAGLSGAGVAWGGGGGQWPGWNVRFRPRPCPPLPPTTTTAFITDPTPLQYPPLLSGPVPPQGGGNGLEVNGGGGDCTTNLYHSIAVQISFGAL